MTTGKARPSTMMVRSRASASRMRGAPRIASQVAAMTSPRMTEPNANKTQASVAICPACGPCGASTD